MMHVRVVWMLVHHHLVPMPMPVGFLPIPWEVMLMLMVFVVPMRVAMLQWLMGMLMLVPLSQM